MYYNQELMSNTNSSQFQLPTNRKFGCFFSAVFAFLSAYLYWKNWNAFFIVALVVSLFFAIASFLAPQTLAILNRLWYRFGKLIGNIISPIVLAFIFFILITPISLLTRLFGRDELKIKKSRKESYWVDRSPPGPPSETFKNQY